MSLTPFLQNRRYFYILNNLNVVCQSYFSSKAPNQKIDKEINSDTGEIKTKKTFILPKITLLTGDQLSVTTLVEAEKISKRRDLKLVKISDLDTKTQRPIYKLMTGAEFHAEDLKQRELKKAERKSNRGEKILLINSKIAQYDLETQIRKAVKWIGKMYEVKVIISGAAASPESSEKVYAFIEKHFAAETNARIVQKRTKGVDVRCQIIPCVPKSCDL